MKAKDIKSFPTIDLCVDYLINLGCRWSYKKEEILKKQCLFKYRDVIVFYDEFELLT